MKPENLIAYRYLRSRKRTGILSFLSITSVVGIMLGVATLIVVINVMSGFSDNLLNKIAGANSDITVSRYDNQGILNYNKIQEKIKNVDGVKAVAPFVMGQVLLTNDKSVTGIVVKGISPEEEQHVSKLPSFMISGYLDDLLPKNKDDKSSKIIIGKEMAVMLGATVGEEITVISPILNRGPLGMMPKMKKFVVAGIYDTGIHDYNSTIAYIPLELAQTFFNQKDMVSGFNVSKNDKANMDIVVAKISVELNGRYWVRDWLSMNISLFSAIQLEKVALFVILTLIIVVASFNIVSMIAITIKDKRKDIAILRAAGASSKFITRIFMKQGLIVGITGTILGDLVALILSLIIRNVKIIELPADVYFMDKIQVNMDIHVYIIVTVCAVLITFLATILPSRQAAKMSPIDALRNE